MVLGLDLATKSGWCLMDYNGKVVASGVQDFSKRRGESNGLMFLRFRNWLYGNFNQGFGPPSIVAYERAHMRGGAATEICVGFQTHAQSFAADMGAEMAPVPTTTLKKWATGHGKADKSAMMYRAASFIGRDPIDDNEADAILVAAWAAGEYGMPLNGGTSASECGQIPFSVSGT